MHAGPMAEASSHRPNRPLRCGLCSGLGVDALGVDALGVDALGVDALGVDACNDLCGRGTSNKRAAPSTAPFSMQVRLLIEKTLSMVAAWACQCRPNQD
jgi:hypothetical protein